MGGNASGYMYASPISQKEPFMFQLAKRGFDVWFTNNSGVQYSQEHKTLSIYDKEYWQIDWIKYGTIDFPAAVEEIRKRNGNKKVAVVGHS